jgi:hypothetical protein
VNGSLDGGTTEHNKKKAKLYIHGHFALFFKKQEALPPYW